MIVWGGFGAGVTNTGARYDPGTDGWAPTLVGAGVPSARARHTAVWTDSGMIVWGGSSFPTVVNTGARYDPATDGWTPRPRVSAFGQ